MQANIPKDTTLTKIFVGGLPYHTTDESLRTFFSKFGEIEEAVVITDRSTGKSRGYGFVTMARKESAEEAVKEANPTIDGRRANVNLAYLGAKNRSANVPFSYGLVTRMPTYPSTAAAAAYPSTNFFYYPLNTQQTTLQQPIYLAPTNGAPGAATSWPTSLFTQLNVANLSTATTSASPLLTAGTASPQTLFELTAASFDNQLNNNAANLGQQMYWPTHN